MTDVLPEDLCEPIWFQFTGNKDGRGDIEENVNFLSGKALFVEFKRALVQNGWSESTEWYDSKIFPEDWGWCLFMRHEGALMMLGAYVLSADLDSDEGFNEYLNEEWVDGGILVTHFHKRTLTDRLRGRNKADPEVHERAYRSVWNVLSGLSYVRGLSTEHPGDR